MVLFHDRRQLGRSGGTKPFCAKPGMVLIDLEPGSKPGNDPNEQAQRARPCRFEEDGQAAIDHGKSRALFSNVMEQRCLLQDWTGLGIDAKQGMEYVDPMPLVIDGQLEQERCKRGTKKRLGTTAISRSYRGGGMPPELSYPVERAGHRSVTVDQWGTPAELLLEQPKEIPFPVELHKLHLWTGADFDLRSR